MATKAGAHVPGLGKFTWCKDPGSASAPPRPCFVVHESFARSHRLARGPAVVEACVSQELNYATLAFRHAGGLSKDAAAAGVRLLVLCLGEAAGRGDPIRLAVGVGELRILGRKLEVTFKKGVASPEAAAAAAQALTAPMVLPSPPPAPPPPPPAPRPAMTPAGLQSMMLSAATAAAGLGAPGGLAPSFRVMQPPPGPSLPTTLTSGSPAPPPFAPGTMYGEELPLPADIARLTKVEQDYYVAERARGLRAAAEVAHRERTFDERRAAFDAQAVVLAHRRRNEGREYGAVLEAQMAQHAARKAADRADTAARVAAAVIGHDDSVDRTAEAEKRRAYRQDLDGQVWAKQQAASYAAANEHAIARARLDEVNYQMAALTHQRAAQKAAVQAELQITWAAQVEAKRQPAVFAKPIGVVSGTARKR